MAILSKEEIKNLAKEQKEEAANEAKPTPSPTGRIPDETDKDKSVTIGDYRFTLGNEGKYLGYPIVAGFKITGAAKFKKDQGKYQMIIPFTVIAQIIGIWLKEENNKKEFNRLLEIEKLKNIGAPQL